MREKKRATLVMKKMLQAGKKVDGNTYICSVHSYQEQTERLCLLLEEGELTDLSLDGVYECRIWEEAYEIQAVGRIKERYRSAYGPMVEMRVENGFYKNRIKSVDKK